jgi:hypothetical protein
MKSPFYNLADRMNSQEPSTQGKILVHTDTEPLQVKGRLLSGKEWENIAEVDEAIAQAALKDWQDAAPVEQFGEILDARDKDE